jgi:hypothetical protein
MSACKQQQSVRVLLTAAGQAGLTTFALLLMPGCDTDIRDAVS